MSDLKLSRKSGDGKSWKNKSLYLGSTPHPVTVANEGFLGFPTKNVIILVVTVTGWGVDLTYTFTQETQNPLTVDLLLGDYMSIPVVCSCGSQLLIAEIRKNPKRWDKGTIFLAERNKTWVAAMTHCHISYYIQHIHLYV